MKESTRHKIIAQSRIHFNKFGFGASTLYKIAQDLNISRGNLTYHFKDKECLLDIHLDDMARRSQESFTNSFLLPSWETLGKTSNEFIQVQKDYAFIFFDKNILLLPRVQEKIKAIKNIHIKIQMSMIHVSIQSGNMKAEPIPGVYHNISRVIWRLLFFNLMATRFKSTEEVGWDKLMWSLLLPYFTEKGIKSFINHFGQEYYDNLGLNYEEFMADMFTF